MTYAKKPDCICRFIPLIMKWKHIWSLETYRLELKPMPVDAAGALVNQLPAHTLTFECHEAKILNKIIALIFNKMVMFSL